MFSLDTCVLKSVFFRRLKLSDENSVLSAPSQDEFELGYSHVRVFTS